jgi:hypothetical protein
MQIKQVFSIENFFVGGAYRFFWQLELPALSALPALL